MAERNEQIANGCCCKHAGEEPSRHLSICPVWRMWAGQRIDELEGQVADSLKKIRFHEWLVANADALLSAAERLVAAEQRIDGERIAALEAERDALKQERDRLQRAYKILREWGESIAKCADRWADAEDARKALAMAREVLGE